jgi:hypothetical protein
MHAESRASQAADGSRLERAIILQLLRDDRATAWRRAELRAEVEADGEAIAHALERLAADGVVSADADEVAATRPVRRLDELGLIAL